MAQKLFRLHSHMHARWRIHGIVLIMRGLCLDPFTCVLRIDNATDWA